MKATKMAEQKDSLRLPPQTLKILTVSKTTVRELDIQKLPLGR